jgi:alpha-L-rhamnosidase
LFFYQNLINDFYRYHGFRYLQVENLTYLPQASDLKSYTLRTNNDIAGTFNSSIELLNIIHKIVNRAVQSNMQSVFTDCPHREKLGWLEQTHLVFPSIQRFFDIQAHGRSVVRKIAEAQLDTGMVPTTAPEYTMMKPNYRDDPNWGNSIVLLSLYLYQSYGETAFLEEFYPNMVSWVDYLTSRAIENIVSYGLGDWAAVDRSTPKGVTGTYGYWISANGIATIAAALNKTADAQKYSELASNISSAFHRTYFNATAHTYAAGSQAADAFALEMGAVPLIEQQHVIQHLINDIRQRNNHTSCGEISLPSWFRMLSFYGHDDVVYDFLSRTDSPSYGYAIVHGATSLTESWDGPAPPRGQNPASQNHFMFGAVDEWLMRSLAGIQQAPNSIDYRVLDIKPAIVGNIRHVEATYRTTRGWIKTQWDRNGTSFTLKVKIPYGSIANVHVPGTNATSDYGRLVHVANGTGKAVFNVGSGTYTFESVTDALNEN